MESLTSKSVSWYHHVFDFANILKAFIGTNYLSLAYTFSLSGLGMGVLIMIIVCIITVHCCQLIVYCKNDLIDDICYKYMYQKHRRHNIINDCNMLKLKQDLQDSMTYSDIGKLAVGKYGGYLVKAFIVITQTGFCIQYSIFIGNMLYQFAVTETTTILNVTQDVFPNRSNSLNNSSTDIIITQTQSAVPLELLVFLTVFLFIPQTLFRNIRHMGIISAAANLCAFIGFWCVLLYIVTDFSVSDTFSWVNLSTLPISIGSIVACYEAIGCIIALNLPADEPVVMVINIALIIGIILTYPLQVFPITEVLEMWLFGSSIQIQRSTSPSNVSQNTLCISGETYNENNEDAPLINSSKSQNSYKSQDYEQVNEKTNGSMELHDDQDQFGTSFAVTIPKEVPSWKRNLLRIVLAISIVLLGVALRNVFVYVGALVGALGSCPLSFVLPCLFHMKIRKQHLSRFQVTKDILIMIFGTVCGVIGVVVTLVEIIKLA